MKLTSLSLSTPHSVGRLLGTVCLVVLLATAASMPVNGQEASSTPPAASAPAATPPAVTVPSATPPAATEETATSQIDADLAAIESDAELDETTKTRLTAMLQQAKKTLLQSQAEKTAADQYEQLARNAVNQQAEVQAKLDAIGTQEPTVAADATLVDLSSKLAAVKSQLVVASKEAADLATESTRRRARLAEIPGLLTAAEREQGEIASQQAQPAALNESAAESQARTTLLAARAQEIANRIESLQNEQAAYTGTVELLPLQRKLADATVAQLRRESEMLQAAVTQKLQSQVEATATDLQHAADAVPQKLRDLVRKNVQLAESQKELLTQGAESEQTLLDVQAALEEVKADQKSSKERLDAVGLTEALGVMFRQQTDDAKKLRYKFRPREDLKKKVQEYQLNAFVLEDELAQVNQWLDRHEPLPIEWDKLEIAWEDLNQDEAEWVLYKKRAQLIESTLQTQNVVLQTMLTSDTQRRELLLLIDEFTAFVDRNLFWSRNAPAISLAELSYAPKAIQWVSTPTYWANAVSQMVFTVTAVPIASLGIILSAFAILLGRSRARRIIKEEGEEATKINVGFGSTIRALIATFVAAMVWPACLGTFAFLLLGTSAADSFVRGLGYAFAMAALYVASRELLSKVCRDKGVAECHFGWTDEVRKHLRRHLRWYTLAGALIIIPMAIFHEHPDVTVRTFATRVTSTTLFLVTAAFHHLMLRHQSPIYVQAVLTNPDSWIYRFRKLIWTVCVGVPILFAAMSLAGYLETTYRLGHSLQSTFLLLVVIVLVYGLLSRWLMLRRRDLARRKAMEERQRRLAEMQTNEPQSLANEAGIVFEKEESIDIASLDEQGRQTAVVVTSVLAIVGFGFIWSDLIPALEYFDDVSLWSVGTGEAIESVSLLDLIYCVFGVALIIYATRVVPLIFELMVHGRTSLDAGARYAVSTLLRYFVVVIGCFFVMNLLSVPYDQLGWLVAAASVGLGFGLQEIVANFVSGIILLLERPVRVGDVVTIDGITGVVSRIQMRATTVTNWDRKELVIPNKDLITQKLLNWSLSNVINRLTIQVGVAYGSDPDQVRELLYRVVRRHPEVLSEPPPLINFEAFGDSSLNFVIRFFLEKLENRIEITHQINTAIAKALADAGITIPFPQRDLHLDLLGDDAMLPIVVRDDRPDDADK